MPKAQTNHYLLRTTQALSAALFLAALPGCQIWNAWLDALKWRDLGAPAQPQTALTGVFATPQTLPPSAPAALIPRVTVYRITLPVGAFSSNEKVWAQLNEDALDSKTAVLMAQNGLRTATGPLSRWPSIAQLLDAPGAATDQFIYQTDGRSAVNVVTRPGVADQIVVSVDRDLQQQGRTFERCDNGFRLAMRPIRNKPELQVQLEPIVTLGTVNIMRTGNEMGIRSGSFSSEESFSDLRMAATLTAETFLVVSAMDPRTSPFSVGTLWLSDKEKAPPTETVLIFVPIAPAPAVPAKAAAK